jgi:hypothetical protein
MRIVAFGCSYAFGHGLSDCLADDKITQGDTPSKLAFPSLLSKKLNCECINLSKSGNSNKEIWNDILNFKFQDDDIVIITWTYYSRFCIIKSNAVQRINPWNARDKLFFMNYSSRNDMILDFYIRLNHINTHLKNIKTFNYVIEDCKEFEPVWNTVNILGTFNKIDEADDNCHPGEKSHLTFANTVYNHIVR